MIAVRAQMTLVLSLYVGPYRGDSNVLCVAGLTIFGSLQFPSGCIHCATTRFTFCLPKKTAAELASPLHLTTRPVMDR